MYDHRQFVCQLISDGAFRNVAEVGVFQGILSDRLFRLDLDSLLLVDPLRMGIPHCSRRVFEQQELDDIHASIVDRMPAFGKFLRMESLKAAALTKDGSLDLVFIDANHDLIAEDIDAWLPKIRSGGVISGDDYSSRFPLICQTVDQRFPDRKTNQRVWWCEKNSLGCG